MQGKAAAAVVEENVAAAQDIKKRETAAPVVQSLLQVTLSHFSLLKVLSFRALA